MCCCTQRCNTNGGIFKEVDTIKSAVTPQREFYLDSFLFIMYEECLSYK